MMTFEQFRATKKQIADLSVITSYDEDKNAPALTYLDDFYIALDGGKYRLMIGRDEVETEDLESLERKLYEYALEEGYCG